MRIRDSIDRNGPSFSFEFFPPQTPQGEETLLRTLENLRPLRPAFVSITYGAGGTTRDKTVQLACHIKNELGIETMAHLTCVGASAGEIREVLARFKQGGIENVLALRGDPPRDQPAFVRPEGGFGYATELVHYIRKLGQDFCLGGACYPEGHVEAPDRDTDLAHFREKANAGLDFAITQLFFNNEDYFSFVDRARRLGISIPIIPGIWPITNVAQIERITTMCGARIPQGLLASLDAVRDNAAAVREVGVAHATAQCKDLLARGVPGIHFYTMNQSPATRAIVEELRG